MPRTICLILFVCVFIFGTSYSALAAGYQPLSPIPGLGGGTVAGAGDGDIAGYLKNLYSFGVAVAAGLAVIMVIFGGIQYITSVSGEGKGGGKDRITSAILGLLLALGSYIILATINKDLLELDFEFKPDKPLIGTPSVAPTFPEIAAVEAENRAEAVNKNFNPSGAPVYTVPAGAPPLNASSLASYRQNNNYIVTDNGGHTGRIAPEIAYMRDVVPGLFNGLNGGSTYRSAEWNSKVGGSSGSDHLHGNAIDFFNGGSLSPTQFSQKGKELVNWAVGNGQTLGIDQVIFQNTNLIRDSSTNTWRVGNPVGGHNDHVHIGRQ